MTSRRLLALSTLIALLAVTVAVSVTVAIRPRPAQAAGTIAYPDLISVIPTDDFAITHPTAGTKEFDYEHIVFNAGQGPLDIMPSYNPATNTATGTQRLYSYDAGGTPVLEQQVPVNDQFIYHALHGHFHFPLATFGLYAVSPDGSMGSPVALSPKNGFCIGDSVQLDPTLPHSPTDKIYVGYTCTDPTAVRGIDPGWGDLYNRNDPGQAIDITGVPDGTYWFHSMVDPANNFAEADKANNVTNVMVRISGDTVTPLTSSVSQGSFVIDKSFIDNGPGTASTPAFATAAPNELLVALVSAQGGGNPQTATVSGGGLSWSLARRTNSQAGSSEVWTALATTPLTNAVVTSTLGASGFDQSLTVFAIQGALGVGATAGASGGTGAPSVGLTTTVDGSWVMAVGNDPDHDIPRTPVAGQTIVQQWVNETGINTSWVQSTPAPTPAGTAVAAGDSYPTGDRWNMSAVELIPAVSNDHTPPAIAGFAATAIGPDRATVGWSTDEPATTQIDYGTTPSLGQSTTANPVLVTAHAQTLTGLSPSTTYFCQLRSVDAAGNEATSAGHSFTTTAPRTTPPVFTNVRVTDLQPDQATFGWTTDEPADSQVEFGTTAAYGSASARDPNQVTAHFVLVTGLTPSTTYHYRVDGTDPYGNAGTSTDATFTTPGVAPPIVVDKTVFKDGRGAQTTAPFSTAAPGELLVAFVSSDGPKSGPQSAVVSGAGLTWTLMRRTNSQPGTAEVWQALAPGTLTNVTVTSSQGNGTYDQSLTVVAFQGAVGVGASAGVSALSGAPTATFTATRFGSLVYGVGNDWDRAVAHTPTSGQSLVHQWVDTTSGDTFWSQALNVPGGPVETLSTISDTAPTNDRFNLTAVEITRPLSVTAAPPAISAVTAGSIGVSSATVSWTTDQAASSQVDYGTTTAYGSSTTLDSTPVVTHAQTLTGLTAATPYHYRVRSTNGAGTTVSPDATFTTLSSPANQTITFAPLAARTLVQSPFTVTATASSGLAVTFSSLTPSVCTSGGTNGATITLVAVGTCTVQADQAGNGAFNPAPSVSQGFAVSKAAQTITFAPLAARTLVQSPFTVTATASSGLAVTFSSLTPSVCTSGGTNGATITLVAVGTCTVQADQAGNGLYDPAPSVSQGFAVSKAAQTITFAPLSSRTLAQSPFTVTATASSGLAVTFSSLTPSVCTSSGLLGATITLVAVGTCTVQADQAGNGVYNPAPSVPQSFSVTTVPVGVSVDASVFKDGRGAQTTAAFSTPTAGDLVVAFVASDGPRAGGQTSVVSGAGLTWSLVRRTNTQAGSAEVWQARASGVLTNVTFTATPGLGGYDQSLTVVAFKGAVGVGASNGASALTGAPAVTLTTTQPGSWVYGVGNDWDRAQARTPKSGQSMVHEWVDTPVGDSFWTQSTSAAVAAAPTAVVFGDSAPTNDRWNLTAVEIRAS